MTFDQSEFEVRCEWGESGLRQLAPISDVVIIVDVLSFSTCVEIANSRGAIVFPYQWKNESARDYAISIGAVLANHERKHEPENDGWSLSPSSLINIPDGTKLVLPSPNGSALSASAGSTQVLAACLRNCRAAALAAEKRGSHIAVIPAGERWSDGSLRPAFEDLIGAGAVISYLKGSFSPEAKMAFAAYSGAKPDLSDLLKQCSSGKELIERGFGNDVNLASEFDVSECVPALTGGKYFAHISDQ